MIGPFVAACARHYDAACASADAKMAIVAPYLYAVLAIEIAVILFFGARALYKKTRA